MKKSNIVLTGMPSSGKSTVGKCLAKKLGMNFMDTDAVILEKTNRPLKEIVAEEGLDAFLRIQEETVLGLKLDNHVIATGGSVVYSEASMSHLGENGFIVFLKAPLEEIESRVDPSRRLARNSGKSLRDLYFERMPLYEKYADIVIDCKGRNVDEIAHEIAETVLSMQGGK